MDRNSLVVEVAQGLSAVTGEAYFRMLVEKLGETLEVEHAFVAEVVGTEQPQMRMLAVHVRGLPVDNFNCEAAGTPGADIRAGSICVIPAAARKKFPGNRLLADREIEGYAAAPLFDAHNRRLGLLAVMDRRALADPGRVENVLRMFAPRAAAELERKKVEDSLRKSEEFHRLISELTLDYAYDCVVAADGTVTIESITDGFSRVTGYTLAELQALGGWLHLLHPDDVPQTLARMSLNLRGESAVNELRILTKAGEVRWIRYSTQPVWDANLGRVTRLLGAVQDITPGKQSERKLQAYAQSLQTLSRRLIEVQEQERRHLARELHDEIGQVLTGLKLSLEAGGRLPDDQLRHTLAEAQRLVQDLTGRIRDLSSRLRPAMLDDLGLLPSLLWHFERYTRQTGVQVRFEHYGLERRFHPDVETAGYRIIQEALTNVARHAGVSKAGVRVRLEQDALHLQISDRGKGYDAKAALAAAATSGLSGIQERVRLLGGLLDFDAEPGNGACVTAELPLRKNGERPLHDDAVFGG
jgi:PAS domain S-box-containing protein